MESTGRLTLKTYASFLPPKDIMDIRTGKVKRHFRKGPGSEFSSSFIYCFYALQELNILAEKSTLASRISFFLTSVPVHCSTKTNNLP